MLSLVRGIHAENIRKKVKKKTSLMNYASTTADLTGRGRLVLSVGKGVTDALLFNNS